MQLSARIFNKFLKSRGILLGDNIVIYNVHTASEQFTVKVHPALFWGGFKKTRPVFCKQNSTSRLIFESDLYGSSQAKNIFTIRKPIHDFLSSFY